MGLDARFDRWRLHLSGRSRIANPQKRQRPHFEKARISLVEICAVHESLRGPQAKIPELIRAGRLPGVHRP